ncbi:hypothetical protein C1645_255255 [Glomus cerebriforme]|uniref:Uncharacterized protein n=1 Tax=Glomus cerebriforme TaxID=658196 RepID=A0A397SZD9_9GLOM|nr:hypothetical protein C1645_255255 [Glomus cerebriforme]
MSLLPNETLLNVFLKLIEMGGLVFLYLIYVFLQSMKNIIIIIIINLLEFEMFFVFNVFANYGGRYHLLP